MASKLPFYKMYPGDEKRNGSRQVGLAAEGLLKRLKDEAHDTERRGYFTQNMHPMDPGFIAKLCSTTQDELMNLLTELACVKLVAYAQDGALYVPEIVRQDSLRLNAIKSGVTGGNPHLKKKGVKGGLKAPLKVDDNETDSVVSVVKAVSKTETATEKLERKDPVSHLVRLWKHILGIPKDDKVWNKTHWGRCSAAAFDLLAIFQGDKEMSADCMVSKHAEFTKAGLNFTLETVVHHAHEWRNKNGKPAPAAH